MEEQAEKEKISEVKADTGQGIDLVTHKCC